MIGNAKSREPDDHDRPLTERLRRQKIGKTITVNAEDLHNATIHAVYLKPNGCFGPGQWMKIAKTEEQYPCDFALKTRGSSNVLYFSVRKFGHRQGETTIYGLSELARTPQKPRRAKNRKHLKRAEGWHRRPNQRAEYIARHNEAKNPPPKPPPSPLELAIAARSQRRRTTLIRPDGTPMPPSTHTGNRKPLQQKDATDGFQPIRIVELTQPGMLNRVFEVQAGHRNPIRTLRNELPGLSRRSKHPTQPDYRISHYTKSQKNKANPGTCLVVAHYAVLPVLPVPPGSNLDKTTQSPITNATTRCSGAITTQPQDVVV